MRLMLGTPNESQMMFPLFLAGVCTQHEAGRTEIMSIFTKFSQRVQVRNVFTIVNLLIEVWKRDPDGDKYIDWRKLAEEVSLDVARWCLVKVKLTKVEHEVRSWSLFRLRVDLEKAASLCFHVD
jgi:hypothetical protein